MNTDDIIYLCTDIQDIIYLCTDIQAEALNIKKELYRRIIKKLGETLFICIMSMMILKLIEFMTDTTFNYLIFSICFILFSEIPAISFYANILEMIKFCNTVCSIINNMKDYFSHENIEDPEYIDITFTCIEPLKMILIDISKSLNIFKYK